MQSAKLVRINNEGNGSAATYEITAGTGVELRVEEEQSADPETAHVPEDVGYAVFEGSA
jgi:hypothetical protein